MGKSSSSIKLPSHYRAINTWQVIPLSLTGSGHLVDGVECQDSYAFRVRRDALVLAVADGHGSHVLSSIGARLATDVFLSVSQSFLDAKRPKLSPEERLAQFLQSFRDPYQFSRSLVKSWRHLISERLGALSQTLKADLKLQQAPYLFGTTLLGAILIKDIGAIYFRLGDGNICYQTAQGFKFVFPEKSELGLVGSEVYSLSSHDAQQYAQVEVDLDLPSSIALFTDGVDDSFDSRETLQRAIAFFWQHSRPPEDLSTPFLSRQLEVMRRASGDDSTLLLAHTLQ